MELYAIILLNYSKSANVTFMWDWQTKKFVQLALLRYSL